MQVTFDKAKRDRTLAERGLAFEDAVEVFRGLHFTVPDERVDYGEKRYLTFGLLRGRLVSIVWTPRDGAIRIISMRHANDRERARYLRRLG